MENGVQAQGCHGGINRPLPCKQPDAPTRASQRVSADEVTAPTLQRLGRLCICEEGGIDFQPLSWYTETAHHKVEETPGTHYLNTWG